jgi:predicted metal-binding protein
MAQDTLLVCILCRCSQTEEQQTSLSDGQSLFNRLQDGLKTIDNSHCIRLQSVRCMGACDRACLAAFVAANKLTFILSQLSPTDAVPDLLQFSHQYMDSSDGKVPYKDRPITIKQKIHAVLPPLPARFDSYSHES